MAMLRVTVQNPGEGNRRKVELPGDVQVERLLMTLPQRIGGTPLLRDDGNPIDFSLLYKGRQLPPNQTLGQAGVQDDDILTLSQEGIAGLP